MLIRELVSGALKLLVGAVGVDGLAIGLLATIVAALVYLRHAADLFVVLARYARIASIVGVVVLLLYIAGVATGVVDAADVGSFLKQFAGVKH